MQLSGKTNRKICWPAWRGPVDSRSNPELLIPQLRTLWFVLFYLFFGFCFKLKYPLTAVEGFPDSPNSFQGKRLKTDGSFHSPALLPSASCPITFNFHHFPA